MEKLNQYAGVYKEESLYDIESILAFKCYSDRIISLSPCGDLLELGIGHGETVKKFSQFYKNYTIIEGSDEVIKIFQGKYNLPDVEITHSLFEEYCSDNMFDIIIMGFILEHVEDPEFILKRFKQFLKPEGHIYITVPNARSLHRLLGFEAGLLKDLYQLSDYDNIAGHKRYFDSDSIKKLVEYCGYTITNMEGIFLKPLNTVQLNSLNLKKEILMAMFQVGLNYPDISNSILIQAIKGD